MLFLFLLAPIQACFSSGEAQATSARQFVLPSIPSRQDVYHNFNELSKYGSITVASKYDSPTVQHKIYLETRKATLKPCFERVSIREVPVKSEFMSPICALPNSFISTIPPLKTGTNGKVSLAFPKWQTNIAEHITVTHDFVEAFLMSGTAATPSGLQKLEAANQMICQYYFNKLAWKRPLDRIIRTPLKMTTIKLPHFSDYSRPPTNSAWKVSDIIRFVSLASEIWPSLDENLSTLLTNFKSSRVRHEPSLVFPLIAPFEFVEPGQPEVLLLQPTSPRSIPRMPIVEKAEAKCMMVGYLGGIRQMLLFNKGSIEHSSSQLHAQDLAKIKVVASKLSYSIPLPINYTESEMLEVLRQNSDRLIQPYNNPDHE